MAKPFSDHEIENLRNATPGVADHIHFNNAGASLPSKGVMDAVQNYLQEEAMIGGYKLEADRARELNEFYTLAAQMLNASPHELAIVESATIAWRIVFNGIKFEKGDIILTSEPEYGSNIIAFLQAKEQFGVETKVIPNDEDGQISTKALEELITPQTKLIAISHIPSNTGIVQPAKEIGEIAKRHGILYLLDGCQSIGQIPLDVKELHCDFFTATGRKFLRAPRGTGFLFVKKEQMDLVNPTHVDMLGAQFTTDPNTYVLRSDARRYETFEGSRALQMGLIVAMREALDLGMDKVWQRVHHLGQVFREKLAAIPGITVQDIGIEKGGIVTFFDQHHTSHELYRIFEKERIRVSVTPKAGAIIYMHGRELPEMVRASIHYYNTEAEIDRFCEVLLNSRP